MIIKKQCLIISDFKQAYPSLLKQTFEFDDRNREEKLDALLDQLRQDLHVVIEFPYTDKLYRDTYYHFYAARHQPFRRDSIRIFLFSQQIQQADLLDASKDKIIQAGFLGFFVLRPLRNRSLGRSMISPLAFSNTNFVSCLSRGYVSFFGLPLAVDAYPHSTQDSLAMSCAETCLWGIMEYFGHRYAEYSTILPSNIYSVLQSTYYQRSVPSNGLTALQLSTALRRLGFGTKLYAVDKVRSPKDEIFRIVSTYVESGIPVIIFIHGEKFGAHSIVLIGHESVTSEVIEAGCKSKVGVIDSADFEKKYIGADDNKPIYQSLSLDKPLAQYTDSKYHDGSIVSVIVPLYERTFLDAIKARKLVYRVIEHSLLGWPEYRRDLHIARLLLTSGRSFKKWLRGIDGLPEKLRQMLLGMHFPKFVWLAEYATKENYLQGRADSLVCLDATGDDSTESLLFARYPNFTLWLNSTTGKHDRINIPSPAIRVYQNNLKGEWNGWKST